MSVTAKSLMDLVREKKQSIQAQSGRREKTVKPTPGKNRFRILPGWRKGDPTFFHDFGQHFIKDTSGELKAIYVCSDKIFGKPCEVCDAIAEGIKHAKDDGVIKTLTEAKSKGRVLMNALHLDGDDPTTPVILDLTPGTFEKILGIIEEYGDITDLDEGTDIVIERSGKGINTEYSIMPAPKSKAVPASVLDKLHNLDEYVKQEFDAGKNKAIAAVGDVAGRTLLSSSKVSGLLTGSKKEDAIDLDDEIPDFSSKASKMIDIDPSDVKDVSANADDDLKALLAELE